MKSLIIAFVCWSAIAVADDTPWSAGVSEDEQTLALEIYKQGNAEFEAARFGLALTKYAEALTHWDHPAIHFNMAVCLINLDQPLEAKKHLDRALAFGAGPLGKEMYAEGITHRHSLDGQIAKVRVVAEEPGAIVSLDGAYLFTAPGDVERDVLPGRHQVVATKRGFLTASEDLELIAAKQTTHHVHLIAFKPAAKWRRRWPSKAPWGVAAAGLGVMAAGLVTYWRAEQNFAAYDAEVARECPRGCATTAGLDLDRNRRGLIERDVAWGLLGVGAGVTLAGSVGILINQPRQENAPSVRQGVMLSLEWKR